jgi:pyruvate/2-oxoglutarate dehydrogenase complex dihydrolipoamide dehydrogenase (E3) component
MNSTRVEEIITEDGKVKGVKLNSGETIETETVILSIGYHPNSELAKASGVRTGVKGGIWVDEYMRTSVEDVFAVGDCAEKKNFLTRDLSNVMLASTATAEARIAGSSLYNLRYVKGFTGTVATFSTVVGNLCFSSVGITESEAQKEKIDFVTGEFEIINRHPAVLPGATKQKIKLVAMKRTGAVIGGQVVGGVESGELVNLIGLMVENKMTIYSIINLQFATHPLLTASPLAYPVVKSAEMIAKKIDSCFI